MLMMEEDKYGAFESPIRVRCLRFASETPFPPRSQVRELKNALSKLKDVIHNHGTSRLRHPSLSMKYSAVVVL